MSQRIAAPTISERVRGARSKSSSLTGERVSNENPRPGHPYSSPPTRFFTKIPYCWYHGLSRPNCWRTSASVSSVGTRPANRVAGSPDGSRKKMT
jgi:hypothetical protein